jgi:4-amino-4-deoxy-L-arabinose transferase-like glycosyltransferase
MDVQQTWRSWLAAVFGAWFVVDSFIYSSAKAHSDIFWSFLVIGALILIGSVWVALQAPREQSWRSWVVAVLSAWIAVSPWALKFSSHSTDTWITLVVGVLGVAASVWVALMPSMSGSTSASGSRSSSV